MSIIRCDGCGKQIDSDYYEIETHNGYDYCFNCFSKYFFTCEKCGKTLSTEVKSNYQNDICINCCEFEADDTNYWNYINSEIDRARGK